MQTFNYYKVEVTFDEFCVHLHLFSIQIIY